ncbi:MAG: heme lyase CcmF/NrfE family subunit [Alphaproteobacteria bacterium]
MQVFVAFFKFSPSFVKAISGIAALTMSLSLLLLLWGMIRVDYSLKVVYDTSHINKPLLYRISALWSGHEGSLMLWAWMLVASIAAGLYQIEEKLRPAYAIVTGFLVVAVIGFVLFFSSPWERIDIAYLEQTGRFIEGRGLNPMLQDPFLAIHPPLLYIGYTALVVPFGTVVATLLNKGEILFPYKMVRSWTIYGWIFLTLGIGFGAFWAWRELGWGGYWFWDPVENSSLMPWLATTALMHSLLLVGKSGHLKLWSMFLAVTTFALSILGMFLVRSGIIQSVHSFMSDSARGLYILGLLLAIAGSGFYLLAAHGEKIITKFEKDNPKNNEDDANLEIVSKEGFLVINNWLLITIALIVLLGTIYPILDPKISAGAPFFNLVLSPFTFVLMALACFAPLIGWGKQTQFDKRLIIPPILALIGAALVFVFTKENQFLGMLGVFVSVLVITSAFILKGPQYQGTGAILHRNGIRVAHLGFGLCAIAVVASGFWTVEKNAIFKVGQSHDLSGYSITLTKLNHDENANYTADQGYFTINKNGKLVSKSVSEHRFYKVERNDTREAGIRPIRESAIYIALGTRFEDGSVQANIKFIPFINLLWAGTVLMALGAFFCLIGPMIPYKKKGKI